MSPSAVVMMLLESDYLCRSRRRVVVVVGSVLSFFVGGWVAFCLPPLLFFVDFLGSFGSHGVPRMRFFFFLSSPDFVSVQNT